MMTTNLFVIANVKQLRTGGSSGILLPFFFQTSWGVGVLNSAIFNSFHYGVEFGTILEGLRNFGGGGIWTPPTPPRYATDIHCLVFCTLTSELSEVRHLFSVNYMNSARIKTISVHRPGCTLFGWERVWIIRAEGRGERLECEAWTVTETLYRPVFAKPPDRGPVPGPGINYTRPQEVLLEFVI